MNSLEQEVLMLKAQIDMRIAKRKQMDELAHLRQQLAELNGEIEEEEEVNRSSSSSSSSASSASSSVIVLTDEDPAPFRSDSLNVLGQAAAMVQPKKKAKVNTMASFVTSFTEKEFQKKRAEEAAKTTKNLEAKSHEGRKTKEGKPENIGVSKFNTRQISKAVYNKKLSILEDRQKSCFNYDDKRERRMPCKRR